MKDFALHLEKIAQVGAMMAPSPAQLYAAQKAEKEYEGLLRANSPKAYATAIMGGIFTGLGVPLTLSLGQIAAGGGVNEKVQKAHTQTYLKEALSGMYGFKGEEAGRLASAMASQKSFIIEKTNDALQLARLRLASDMARGPIDGVSEDVREQIVKRAKLMVDDLAPEMILKEPGNMDRNKAALFQYMNMDQKSQIENFSKIKNWSRMMSSSGHYPTTMCFPGFSIDEINALTSMGAKLYEDRTGKLLNNTKTAIRLISKQLGNSVKAGLPLAVISAGLAARRQAGKAKATLSAVPDEAAAFGEYR